MSSSSEVTVDWVDGYKFVGGDGAGNSLVFDASTKDAPRGVSPMKALLASLGACSGMDVVAFLGKKKQLLTSLKVSVGGTRPEFGYPKPFTSISLRYVVTGRGLDGKVVEEAVKSSVEKYCSVAATINARARIEYQYEILEG